MKRILSIVAILLLTTGLQSFKPDSEGYKIKTVVIDAGHGGHDPGCLGSNSKEKHIALGIALKVGKLIEANHPDVKVIYTRKTDVFVELHERANIANKAKADLFICIHGNSAAAGAYGAETYVMGLHKTDANLAVAKRENAAILLEDDYRSKYDGYDPNSAEANIIFSLHQNAYMHQSLLFAQKVQENFVDYAGRYNRGVKQAGLLVLYKTAMPAVLIEAGFLTNKTEEKYLSSNKGQVQLSTAIYKAFNEYKVDMESGYDGTKTIVKSGAESGTSKSEEVALNTTKQGETKTVKTTPVKKEVVKPTPKPVEVIKETPVKNEPIKAPDKNPATINKSVYYTVQIGAVRESNVSGQEKLAKVSDVIANNGSDGYIRYSVGQFSTVSDASARKKALISAGFKDAYVTAYHNNERISLKEASLLLK